jgi:type II secretory pathway pseudopilin PulG
MLARAATILARLRRRLAPAGDLRGESGFVLMEAVVSTAVLAIVAIGVLAAMDGASASSGRQKARTAAAQLAEQDQERLRSMRAVDLSNHGTKSRTVRLGPVSYTVTSQARWVTDATGSETCTSGPQGDYMRITSTVTSPIVGRATRPVSIESILARPVATFGPGQGTLAVKVTDRDDRALPNVTVAISGPGSYSDLTNAAGCAVFAYVPVDTYDITVAQDGYVDVSGDNVTTGRVDEGVVNVQPVQFDRAASITATFVARFSDVPAGVATDHPVRAASISVANARVPGGFKPFPSASGQQDRLTASSLFPFLDGYSVFTGRCPDANPTRFASSYFTTPGNGGFSNVAPGGSASVQVRQGSLDLTVTRRPASTWVPAGAGMQVKVTPTGTDCGAAMTWTTAGDGRVTKPSTPSFPFDPSLPYGSYSVCASDGSQRGTTTVDVSSVDPRPDPGGTIRLSVSGTCP